MTTGTIAALAALSLVPFLLVMVTSFVKISVVLSLFRSAIGAASVPPTIVITGLAIVLSAVVMAPVAGQVWKAVEPAVPAADAQPTPAQLVDAANRAKEPVRAFLLKHAQPRDRQAFAELAAKLAPDAPPPSENDLAVLLPAFATSELKGAFAIGFLLLLPFLVIDLLVAAVLQSVGMTTLPPAAVSLPFKLLLFVLVDGWLLLAKGLILGYA